MSFYRLPRVQSSTLTSAGNQVCSALVNTAGICRGDLVFVRPFEIYRVPIKAIQMDMSITQLCPQGIPTVMRDDQVHGTFSCGVNSAATKTLRIRTDLRGYQCWDKQNVLSQSHSVQMMAAIALGSRRRGSRQICNQALSSSAGAAGKPQPRCFMTLGLDVSRRQRD